MKRLAITMLVVFSTAVFARVGTQFFNYKVTADTEVELLEKIEEAIPLIQKGKLKSPFQTDCWPNNTKTIKIRNVNTSKAYKYENDQLVAYYIGKINYLHKRCRD